MGEYDGGAGLTDGTLEGRLDRLDSKVATINDSKVLTIYMVGTSITENESSDRNYDIVGAGYRRYLARFLRKEWGAIRFLGPEHFMRTGYAEVAELWHGAHSGYRLDELLYGRSAEGTQGFAHEVSASGADTARVVVVEGGANDVLAGETGGVVVSRYAALIRAALEACPNAVVFACNLLRLGLSNQYTSNQVAAYNAVIDAFNARHAALCAEISSERVVAVDVAASHSPVGAIPDDGIHPSRLGHMAYARTLGNMIIGRMNPRFGAPWPRTVLARPAQQSLLLSAGVNGLWIPHSSALTPGTGDFSWMVSHCPSSVGVAASPPKCIFGRGDSYPNGFLATIGQTTSTALRYYFKSGGPLFTVENVFADDKWTVLAMVHRAARREVACYAWREDRPEATLVHLARNVPAWNVGGSYVTSVGANGDGYPASPGAYRDMFFANGAAWSIEDIESFIAEGAPMPKATAAYLFDGNATANVGTGGGAVTVIGSVSYGAQASPFDGADF